MPSRMFISLLFAMQCRKLSSEKKRALGYSANSNLLMVSVTSRSGLERMTTKKLAKRALSSFEGATPLVVLFITVCETDFHNLRFAFSGAPSPYLCLDDSLLDKCVKQRLAPSLMLSGITAFCDDVHKMTVRCRERSTRFQHIL